MPPRFEVKSVSAEAPTVKRRQRRCLPVAQAFLPVPELPRGTCDQCLASVATSFLPPNCFLIDRLCPPFYRRLEILKSLTGHGLPYFLITERWDLTLRRAGRPSRAMEAERLQSSYGFCVADADYYYQCHLEVGGEKRNFSPSIAAQRSCAFFFCAKPCCVHDKSVAAGLTVV